LSLSIYSVLLLFFKAIYRHTHTHTVAVMTGEVDGWMD